MSEATKPFDKDIELAKLQALISDDQANYVVIFATMLSTLIALEVVLWSASANSPADVLVPIIAVALLAIYLRLKHRRRFRRFEECYEEIYHGERIHAKT